LEFLALAVPVTVTPFGAVITTRLAADVSTGLELSVTCTVRLLVPASVGVPLITPVEASRLRPVGRLPSVTDQWYGAVPPSAASVAL
jgi:uncharacterized protein YqfA (UPF0365 family)